MVLFFNPTARMLIHGSLKVTTLKINPVFRSHFLINGCLCKPFVPVNTTHLEGIWSNFELNRQSIRRDIVSQTLTSFIFGQEGEGI